MILCESAFKQVYVDMGIRSYFRSSCKPSTIVYTYTGLGGVVTIVCGTVVSAVARQSDLFCILKGLL